MRKLLFTCASLLALASCDKIEDELDGLGEGLFDQTEDTIEGEWELMSSVAYYTPKDGGDVATYDVTDMEESLLYNFGNDNIVKLYDDVDGDLTEQYEYVLNGTDLKLTGAGKTLNMKVTTLTADELVWEHSNTAGQYLIDENDDTLGVITKVEVEFEKL
jgi:hypothetical protein